MWAHTRIHASDKKMLLLSSIIENDLKVRRTWSRHHHKQLRQQQHKMCAGKNHPHFCTQIVQFHLENRKFVHVLQGFKFSRKKKQQQRQQKKKKRQRCCWANRLLDVKLFWLRKIERAFLCVVHNLSLIRQVYYCFVYCLAFSSVSLFSIKYYVIYWVVLLFSPFQWAKLGGKKC